MAPPGEKSVAESQKRPISTVLLVMAMQSEALPVLNKLNLTENPGSIFPEGVNWVRYHGFYKDLDIHLVWPGKDSALGVDSIGTVPASLLTYASIQALQPDIIINAGTAGGFKAKGARVGDIYLASDVAFCDRRIAIPVFDLYGLGMRKSFPTPNLQKELNLKVGRLSTGDSMHMSPQDEDIHHGIHTCLMLQVGRLSTGDSMHMSPQDEATMVANDATIKDMEGAAVAYVADLLRVPTIFVKAVTVQKMVINQPQKDLRNVSQLLNGQSPKLLIL